MQSQTGTCNGIASLAGNSSLNDSGVDLGSPIVPSDAPVAAAPGTGLANMKLTGSPVSHCPFTICVHCSQDVVYRYTHN
jgi:hypothetical protein